MTRGFGAVLLASLAVAVAVSMSVAAAAQVAPSPRSPATDSARQLFTAHELTPFAALVVTSAALMPFDRRLAHFSAPDPLGSGTRTRAARTVATIGDPGAAVLAATSLLVGRLAHRETLAYVGLHAGEALMISSTVTAAFKQAIGRARPRTVALNDPFSFAPFRGEPGHASLPSGHTTAAFTVVAVLDRELHRRTFASRHAKLATAASVALYAGAAAVGASRMVQGAHWSSDVAAGAGVGIMSGFAIVRQRHAGPAARWERWLMGF